MTSYFKTKRAWAPYHPDMRLRIRTEQYFLQHPILIPLPL